jgi:Uma2 family endonuclease
MRSVNSTEIQNNFGKYLVIAGKEDIIIKKNGMNVARLTTKNIEQDIIKEPDPAYLFTNDEMSYEEFVERTKDTEDRLEFINGQVFCLASPKTRHQLSLIEIFGILYDWSKGEKCVPIMAPYDITLINRKDNKNVVQPDIVVICDLEENLNEQDYYMGTPSLVIEILSEGTKRKDMIIKMELYLSSGVKEYWIVDPDNKKVMTYQFQNDEIIKNAIYGKEEVAGSFIFKSLEVDLKRVFVH